MATLSIDPSIDLSIVLGREELSWWMPDRVPEVETGIVACLIVVAGALDLLRGC